LHNLFGDTNVVSIKLDDDGELEFTEEVEGDTVGEVLSYVEYDTADLVARFRRLTDRALKTRTITAEERRRILDAYANGLRGYTYFED
jgi:arginine decarboxylase